MSLVNSGPFSLGPCQNNPDDPQMYPPQMYPPETYNAKVSVRNIEDIVLADNVPNSACIWKRPNVHVSGTEPPELFGAVTIVDITKALSVVTRNLSLFPQPLGSGPNDFYGDSVNQEQQEIKKRIQDIGRDAGEDGWLDGEGIAVHAKGLQWLEGKLIRYFVNPADLVHLYPTEDGNVQIEYTIERVFGKTEVSVEINLTKRKGYWHSFDFSDKSSEDRSLDLSSETEWEWLSRDFEKAKDKGIVNDPKHSTLAAGSS